MKDFKKEEIFEFKILYFNKTLREKLIDKFTLKVFISTLVTKLDKEGVEKIKS